MLFIKNLPFPLTRGAVALGMAVTLAGCAATQGTAVFDAEGKARLQGEITSTSPVNFSDGSHHQVFSVKLKQGDLVRVQQGGALDGAVLTLVDERNQLVSGPNHGTLHLTPDADGTYRLGVSGSGPSTFGPFQLALEKVSARNGGALELDDSVFGLLTRGNQANDYTLTVAEAGLYEITMTSDDMDTVLKLSGGSVSAEDDDGGDGTNSRLTVQLDPGSYQVTATALDDPAEGAYDLSVTSRPLPEGVELVNGGPIELGSSITGLADSSPKVYSFDVSERSLVRVVMSSAVVDSYLSLQGPGVDVSDDDGAGSNLDAAITTLVAPGSYRVSASTVDGSAGLFTLTTSTQAVNGNGSSLRPGEAVSGVLSGASVEKTLVVREAGHYKVELYSSDFDAMLKLTGNGVELEDDDGAGGTNSRISTYLEAGRYTLAASSYDNNGRGSFVISAEREQ
ncbi:hypothetical protein [Halopseudomonas oceani]|uniref:hypothetical protein n=1 Tax=Halopseudomonas oceani TaxID=1708783 RepID=UPI002AA82D98|nr:hypothetical protein [Halopseudomonas oceani]